MGLAVSDDTRLLAFGRGIVNRTKGFADLVDKIKNLCEKEQVKEIVFGLPFGPEGEENERTQRVRNFSRKLGLYFPEIPIFFIDESYSSYEAQNLLRQGIEKKLHGADDEIAAIIILQRYLDGL